MNRKQIINAINAAVLLKHWYNTPAKKTPEQIKEHPQYPANGNNHDHAKWDLWVEIPDKIISEKDILPL